MRRQALPCTRNVTVTDLGGSSKPSATRVGYAAHGIGHAEIVTACGVTFAPSVGLSGKDAGLRGFQSLPWHELELIDERLFGVSSRLPNLSADGIVQAV